MTSMKAYDRPQREVLSLKTSDIPGAMSKGKIYKKRLVYDYENQNGDGEQPHFMGEDYHNSQFYGRERRMYEKEPQNPEELPDPYELEMKILQEKG